MIFILVMFVSGFITGAVTLIAIIPALPSTVNKSIMRQAVRGIGRGVFEQVGDDLEVRLPSKNDRGEWVVNEGSDDERTYEDVGFSFRLFGKPWGVVVPKSTVIASPLISKIADAEATKHELTDGGEEDYPVVGKSEHQRQDGTLVEQYLVNPYAKLAGGGDGYNPLVADMSKIAKILTNAGGPETPRKAAHEAKQSEQGFKETSKLGQTIQAVTYFVLGGLMVYIGMSGAGGGGGGGGVSLPFGMSLIETGRLMLGVWV